MLEDVICILSKVFGFRGNSPNYIIIILTKYLFFIIVKSNLYLYWYYMTILYMAGFVYL